MAVAIRLMRLGKKGHPYYRIVIKHKKSKQGGAYIEKIGSYDPFNEKDGFTIDEARLKYWLEKGAVVSEGMSKLLPK